jgi:hypothetical protein
MLHRCIGASFNLANTSGMGRIAITSSEKVLNAERIMRDRGSSIHRAVSLPGNDQ